MRTARRRKQKRALPTHGEKRHIMGKAKGKRSKIKG
jgi:hypothetical protein